MLKNSTDLENKFPPQIPTGSGDTIRRLGLAMLVLAINPFLMSFLSAVLLYGIIGVPTDADGSGYYVLVLALNEISSYLLPIVIFGAMFGRECKEFTPTVSYTPKRGDCIVLFLAGIGAGSLGTLATRLVNALIDSVFGTGEIADAFESLAPTDGLRFGAFAVCICAAAPICEEIIFRRLLLIPLRRLGDFPAALLSGLVFGLYHGNFDQFAYAAIVGFFYAVIAIRRNSILPTVILHSLNNFIVTVADYCPFDNAFTSAMSVAASLMFPVGLLAAAAAAITGLMRFEKTDGSLSGTECAKAAIKNPAFVIGFLAMLAMFFV